MPSFFRSACPLRPGLSCASVSEIFCWCCLNFQNKKGGACRTPGKQARLCRNSDAREFSEPQSLGASRRPRAAHVPCRISPNFDQLCPNSDQLGSSSVKFGTKKNARLWGARRASVWPTLDTSIECGRTAWQTSRYIDRSQPSWGRTLAQGRPTFAQLGHKILSTFGQLRPRSPKFR